MFGELIGRLARRALAGDGPAAPVRAGRARPRPRHLDGRCPARHARRAGLPCRARPASRRDQRAAARRCRQRALAAFEPTWHERFDEVPAGPLLLVANEFFDALPVRQFEKTARGWRERMVGLAPDGETLRLALAPGVDAVRAAACPMRPDGAQAEICEAGRALAAAIGARLTRDGGWALIVDYGYDRRRSAPRCRRCAAIAARPSSTGRARPTSAPMSTSPPWPRRPSAPTFGPVGQGDFLRRLGHPAACGNPEGARQRGPARARSTRRWRA